jgi:alkanesulfonate monooxygenase SsuD/methylene tetrahydromethanopterin reductase-like flavin-dependent oxidoreductase (luciferase family)
VIAQAGTSPPGRALAARVGEAIFNFAQTIEEGRELRSDLHERMAEYGREPTDARFLPDVTLLIGRTRDEIDERLGRLDELVDVDRLLPDLSRFIGIDLAAHPLDGPVPEAPLSAGGQTMQRTLVRAAESEQLTIRQLAERFARSIGHFVAGTPTEVADLMEGWMRAGAADGFVIRIADPEPSLDAFVDLVVPELQRRGIFRTEYSGATFREDLGLPRPPSR